MQQPIINDTNPSAQPRNAQVEHRSMEERLEGVEDDLRLLKSEVKQTLIDLREFVMQGSAISVTSVPDAPTAPPSNGETVAPEHQDGSTHQELTSQPVSGQVDAPEDQDNPPHRDSPAGPLITTQSDQEEPAPQSSPVAPEMPFPLPSLGTALQGAMVDPQSRYSMGAIKMGHIIRWLGTVARKGLSPSHFRPFLQTYQQSGHLTPEMAALTLSSLEHLEYAMGRSSQPNSTAEYSDCLLELHEIICNPGYAPKQDSQVGGGHSG